MKDCSFCGQYLICLQTDYISDESVRKMGETPLKHEMGAVLFHKSWKKGDKYHSNKSLTYKRFGVGFKLNFCPECGRTLSTLSATKDI